MKNAFPKNWIASTILSHLKKNIKILQITVMKTIGFYRDLVYETFCRKDTSNTQYKTIEILDFSLLSLTCEAIFFDLELESLKKYMLGKAEAEISPFPGSFPCFRHISIQLSVAQDLSFREFSVLAT